MKTTLKALALTALAVTGLTSLQAQTYYYVGGSGNQTINNDLSDWNTSANGSGSSPGSFATTEGDPATWIIPQNTTIRTRMSVSGNIWYGGTTRFDALSSTVFAQVLQWNTSYTFQDVILNGGGLTGGNGNNTMTGKALTIDATNGGVLGCEKNNSVFNVAFDSISGSGDVRILGVFNGTISPQETNIIIADGTDLSGYTGTFQVLDDADFGFAGDVATTSFGLSVEIADGGGVGAKYLLQNAVSVTTLQLGPDFVAAGGGTGAGGSYQFSDFNAAQQAYLVDNGGTINVTVNGTVTLPTLTQDVANSIDETIATIPCAVPDTGGETPNVIMYYGTSDGGMTAGSWSDSAVVGPSFGDFDVNLTGLTNNTTYFYRAFASNSAGDVWAGASGSFTTGTVPDPVVTTQNGGITESATWIGSPPVPTSGTADTKTWTIQDDNVERGIDPANFAGETLEIGDGASNAGRLRLEPGSGTLNVRDMVLNSNGRLWQDRDNNTVSGDTLTFVTGGHLEPDRCDNDGRRMNLNFDTYAGTGTVYIFGNNANGNNATVFQTTNATPGTAMQGFTGTIHRDRLNGDGGCVRWDFSVTVATFGIKLADTDSDLPPSTGNGGASNGATANGKMFLTDGVDVMVTDMHLFDQADTGLTLIDVHLPDGTYTLDTVTNPLATDLTNVGGNDYSRFFKGGSGTVTVDSGAGPVLTEFDTWADSKGLDGTAGKEDGQGDDPDSGGLNNLGEFGLGGDPLDGNDDGALLNASSFDADPGGALEGVLTIAVRSGAAATFSAGDPASSTAVDGIIYTVAADTTPDVDGGGVAVTPFATPAAISTALGAPPTGYEYASFYISGPEGYFQVSVEAAP